MSRREHDREDLMAEVVALVRRVEFRLPDREAVIVAGFRSNGWLTLYFGPDPMFQFDEEGRLRRAFVNGFLFRTQGSTLARLQRQRMASETRLIRYDLSDTELGNFREMMVASFHGVREQISNGEAVTIRQVPAGAESLQAQVLAGLDRVLTSAEFLSPAFPGKP
jgi:hypothetical protein